MCGVDIAGVDAQHQQAADGDDCRLSSDGFRAGRCISYPVTTDHSRTLEAALSDLEQVREWRRSCLPNKNNDAL